MLFEVYFKNGTKYSIVSEHWENTNLYGNNVYVFYSDSGIFNDQGIIADSTDTTKFDAVINQTDVAAIIKITKAVL